MSILFYHYPSCSTCKKAKKWLEAKSVELESIHIVDAPPSRAQLEKWWRESGLDLKRFFNTNGGSYRALDMKNRYATLTDDERLDLLAADGKLIKRPIVTDDQGGVLVGFKVNEYEDASFL